MVVRHAIAVSGPHRDVEMNLGVRIGYDDEGKVATIDVEPSDLRLTAVAVTPTRRYRHVTLMS